jgi:cell division protein FtsB
LAVKFLRLVLLLLLLLIQWPLWGGEGGWLRAWERERTLEANRRSNDALKQRNMALEAEVHDLRDGTSAIEERARSELGMTKNDEVFVQVLDKKQQLP